MLFVSHYRHQFPIRSLLLETDGAPESEAWRVRMAAHWRQKTKSVIMKLMIYKYVYIITNTFFVDVVAQTVNGLLTSKHIISNYLNITSVD